MDDIAPGEYELRLIDLAHDRAPRGQPIRISADDPVREVIQFPEVMPDERVHFQIIDLAVC